MNENVKELLGEIGRQLDRSIFPVVKNGGNVSPSVPTIFPKPLGQESHHDAKREKPSSTKSQTSIIGREESLVRTWASARTRAPSDSAQILSPINDPFYQKVLDSICEAYSGTFLWEQDEGFWLYSESVILLGLGRKVGFLTGVSFKKRIVKSWAFYSSIVGSSWIGPRHTNFPDGSICAFEQRDQTWIFGDSLVALLDLYSVWALRHLHYETFGRWPGPQSVAHPYERMLELNDDEHCGCGSSNVLYLNCCKESDLRKNRLNEAMKFGNFSNWSLRQPPESVVNFMLYKDQPPRIAELI